MSWREFADPSRWQDSTSSNASTRHLDGLTVHVGYPNWDGVGDDWGYQIDGEGGESVTHWRGGYRTRDVAMRAAFEALGNPCP